MRFISEEGCADRIWPPLAICPLITTASVANFRRLYEICYSRQVSIGTSSSFKHFLPFGFAQSPIDGGGLSRKFDRLGLWTYSHRTWIILQHRQIDRFSPVSRESIKPPLLACRTIRSWRLLQLSTTTRMAAQCISPPSIASLLHLSLPEPGYYIAGNIYITMISTSELDT